MPEDSVLAKLAPEEHAPSASREAYWLGQLSGDLPETNLTPDFVRRKRGARSYDVVAFQLPKDLSWFAHRRSAGDESHVFSILLATVLLVLHKYSGQETLIVGAPAWAARGSDGASPSIVPLLVEIPADATIHQCLAQVADTVRRACLHDAVQLAQLVEALGLEDDGDRCPLFDVFVALEDIHGGDTAHQVNTDLTLIFRSCGDRIEGTLRYRADVVARSTVKRFLAHYKRILRLALCAADTRVSSISLLTEGERRAVLRASQGLARSYPTENTIHALFEEQAVLWADRVAIEDHAQQLSYRQLNDEANRIANLLIELGAKPGEFIAILHERSVTNLACMLGAVKAGGAFVPIDPSYPPDRVSYMLENSEARFLLTNSESISRYGDAIKQCKKLGFVVLSDRAQAGERSGELQPIRTYDGDRLAACSRANPQAATSGHDLCYMIYTSGSTGLPKGAMVRHDGAVNHIYAQFDALNFTPDFSMIQSAPGSSDTSIWQYLGPILIGGKVIVVDTATVLDAEALLSVMKEKRVSVVEFVPVVMRNLMEHVAELSPSRRALPDLKWMMVTGEAVSVDSVNWWLSLYPSIAVVNAYGPSEASDDVAQMIIARPLPAGERSVPIGRPLANCKVYIVDRAMQLVPRGVPGEVCVAGICVGNGYWKHMEKTSAAFLANPFEEPAREMLYRTGDLGRWRSDDTIEFLGRLDQQVKVGGYRIEVEEVEAVLREHPDVRNVAVQVWDDDCGNTRLAAHVVTAADKDPKPSEWRRFMMRKLPEYMVPAVFISIDSLPLAPSGKVNRRALSAPLGNIVDLQTAYSPPRSPTERLLADIWVETLQVKRAGIKDNFFELGGDSILGIQVVNRANKAGIKLKPGQIFTNPTIEQLARLADAATGPLPATALGPMPLTLAQRQLLERVNQQHVSSVSVLGLRLAKPIDWQRMVQAARSVVHHHDALRLRLTKTAGGWRQRVGQAGDILAIVDAEQMVGSDDAVLSAVRTAGARLSKKLDPVNGPMFGLGLVDLGPSQPSWLLVATHGVAADIESWPIIIEDLETAYRQLADCQQVALAPETASFAQFARQVIPDQQPHALAQQFEQGPTVQRRQSATRWLTVDETAVVDEAAEGMHVEIEDLCATALSMIALPNADAGSLTLHVVASRQPRSPDDPDFSRTVGCFTRPISVLLTPEPEENSVARLKSTKERLQAAKTSLSRFPLRDKGTGDDGTELADASADSWHVALVPETSTELDAVSRASRLFQGVEICLDKTEPQPAAGTAMSWRRVDSRLGFTVAFKSSETSGLEAERYLGDFLDALHRLAKHCRASDSLGHTPSDFPLSGLDQARIDMLEHQFPDIEDAYPLGPAQHGIYLQCLLASKSGAYIEQTSLDLRGELDAETLFRAWRAVTRMHPALRTAFTRKGLSKPLQVVSARIAVRADSLDWRHLDPREHAEQWLRLLEKDGTSPFAMAKPPLHRLTLVRLSDDVHRLLLTYHHLIMDGWSETVVLRSLLLTYQRLRSGKTEEPPIDNTYRKHIAWLARQDQTTARAFWRERLTGFTTPTRLSTEKDSAEPKAFASLTRCLSSDVTQALHSFTRQRQLTVNTVLQAAWALTLHLFSSATDIVYGSVVSGRQAPIHGIETMVGMAVNTLPVRVQIRRHDSLAGWLQRLQSELSDIQEFECSALADIQQQSDVAQQKRPLLRSLFVLANYPGAATFGDDLNDPSVENVQLMTVPDFPLTCFAVPGDRLLLRIVYGKDRFEDADTNDFLSEYIRILESILANPNGSVAATIGGTVTNGRNSRISGA